MQIDKLKIGIDFGTTFCFCCFYNENGKIVQSLLPVSESYAIPSVFFDNGTQKLYGRLAEKKLGTASASRFVVQSVKRRLEDNGIVLDNGQTQYTAEMIVTELIGYLVRTALEVAQVQYQIDFPADYQVEAVITVPVDFTEPMRYLIQQAAGRVVLPNGSRLVVTGTLKEPVAASLEYFGEHPGEQTDILVFDLGGGTFDAAWVRANAGEGTVPYTVIDQEGDRELGGDDWDAAIAERIKQAFAEQHGIRPTQHDMTKLRRAAREIKEMLTETDCAEEYIELHGEELEFTLTRAEFDRMTAPLLNGAMECVERLLRRQGRLPGHIILTGGSSLMKQVQEAVMRRCPETDVRVIDPAHAIANGAARYAARYFPNPGKPAAQVVQQIASHAYAVRYRRASTREYYLVVLIAKGEPLPAEGGTTSHTISPTSSTERVVYEVDTDAPKDSSIPLDGAEEIMRVVMEYDTVVPQNTLTTDRMVLSVDEVLYVESVDTINRKKISGTVSLNRRLSKGGILQ